MIGCRPCPAHVRPHAKGLALRVAEKIALIERGPFATSTAWRQISDEVAGAVVLAEWPPGSGSFAIYPESGKKAGEGNGVVPIKTKPMSVLKAAGWRLEFPWEVGERPGPAATTERAVERAVKGSRPGDIDAARMYSEGLVVVEWERAMSAARTVH